MRVEDYSSNISYSGTWSNHRYSEDSDGTGKFSSSSGAYALFNFTGTSVKLITFSTINRGIAKISIDGGTPELVDTYSSSDIPQNVVYTADNLSPGPHTIKVEVIGTKNSNSGSANIFIDAFDIETSNEYFYVRNAQGDIIGLVDENGTSVVQYTYDSWGKLISTTGSLASTVGAKNPYRYRGYRYDSETGLYYLQSRYYNPSWGRFINADGYMGAQGQLLSSNMFSYCGNNPINREDKSGRCFNIIIGAGIGVVVGGMISAGTQLVTSGSINWKSVAVSALAGAASGALAATGVGVIGQMLGNALISGTAYAGDLAINDMKIRAKDVAINAALGAASGALGGRGLMSSKGGLKPVLQETKRIVEREVRRANYKYANQVITKALTKSFNTIYKESLVATTKFVGTSILSSVGSNFYESHFKHMGYNDYIYEYAA